MPGPARTAGFFSDFPEQLGLVSWQPGTGFRGSPFASENDSLLTDISGHSSDSANSPDHQSLGDKTLPKVDKSDH